MPSRKRSRENRNMTAERSQRQTQRASASVNETALEAVRRHLQVQGKNRRTGEPELKYKFWLGGAAMQEILKVSDVQAIATGLVEGLKNGVSIEADAQAVLFKAPRHVRAAIAEAFVAEAVRIDGLPETERKAKFLAGLAQRITPRPEPEVKAEPEAEAAPEPEKPLDAVVSEALKAKDYAMVAVAVVSAKFVDGDVRDMLKAVKTTNPVEANKLAAAIRAEAKKIARKPKRDFFRRMASSLESGSVETREVSQKRAKPPARKAA